MRTVDGQCVVINLEDVQAVSHLEEFSAAPVSPSRYEGPTVVTLRGGGKPLQERLLPPESTADLVMALELGPDVVRVIKLVDDAGVEIWIRAAEVVCMTAAAQTVDEGYAAFESEYEKN